MEAAGIVAIVVATIAVVVDADVVDEIDATDHAAAEVGVVEEDAGIDDGGDDVGAAGRDFPRRRDVDGRVVPLEGVELVGGEDRRLVEEEVLLGVFQQRHLGELQRQAGGCLIVGGLAIEGLDVGEAAVLGAAEAHVDVVAVVEEDLESPGQLGLAAPDGLMGTHHDLAVAPALGTLGGLALPPRGLEGAFTDGRVERSECRRRGRGLEHLSGDGFEVELGGQGSQVRAYP